MAEVQVNLSMQKVKEGNNVNGKKVSKSQADKYNSFYERTFMDGDVEDILERGGGVSLNNFKKVSKGIVKDAGYYDAMFPSTKPTFIGRDGKVRESKLSGRLGEVIFKMLPEDNRTRVITYKRNNKDYERSIVSSGKKVTFNNKVYRGGMFLPKSFFNL